MRDMETTMVTEYVFVSEWRYVQRNCPNLKRGEVTAILFRKEL